MRFDEKAVEFSCGDYRLYGLLSLPEKASARGVLIVVGGPQYRVGSHRQFTLLARHLAAHGVPVLRFDYRGMGDSEGEMRTFEAIDDDLRAAIDQFSISVPALAEVVIWGLCDAASAALFYAHRDPRVTGLVVVNPWVRTERGIAKAYLKHYYAGRFFERDLWRKIGAGRFDYAAAGRSFGQLIGKAFARGNIIARESSGSPAEPALPDRMLDGLRRFNGKVLLILSGNDLTAKEFSDCANASHAWQKLLTSSSVRRHDLPPADHTFSQRDWRDQVADWTEAWLRSW